MKCSDNSVSLLSCQQSLLLQVNPPNKKARGVFIGLTVQSDQNNFPKYSLFIKSERKFTTEFGLNRHQDNGDQCGADADPLAAGEAFFEEDPGEQNG